MFDLLIQNALIIDGSGQPGWVGDLAVLDGRIAALEPGIRAQAAKTIDAAGLVLCPGFIDPHSHWDAIHLDGSQAQVKLRQGVCLDVVGNCGESLSPVTAGSKDDLGMLFASALDWIAPRSFQDYTRQVDQAEPGLGVMSLVGHGTLRVLAMGHRAGPPGPEELKLMKRELALALDQGAAGFSTGLYYTPSGYADSSELEALLAIVAQKGRYHTSHIRNEAYGIFDALDEVIQAGLATGAATNIAHLKLCGRDNWGQSGRVIEMLEKARDKGLDLTCDVYPYERSCTTLLSLFPTWSREGGVPGLKRRLTDQAQRQRIRDEMLNGVPGWESSVQNAGFDGITISSLHSGRRQELLGKTLAEAAQEAGLEPADFTMELALEQSGAVSIINSSMCEEDVAEFIKLPFAMIGSDGSLSRGKPHPRAYGAFPRIIRRFVRELKALSLEEAIAKMSGKTAERVKARDCGFLRKGYQANLVLFDPDEFGDTATFEEPRSFATGLNSVFVKGVQVWTPEGPGGRAKGGFVKPEA